MSAPLLRSSCHALFCRDCRILLPARYRRMRRESIAGPLAVGCAEPRAQRRPPGPQLRAEATRPAVAAPTAPQPPADKAALLAAAAALGAGEAATVAYCLALVGALARADGVRLFLPHFYHLYNPQPPFPPPRPPRPPQPPAAPPWPPPSPPHLPSPPPPPPWPPWPPKPPGFGPCCPACDPPNPARCSYCNADLPLCPPPPPPPPHASKAQETFVVAIVLAHPVCWEPVGVVLGLKFLDELDYFMTTSG